MRKLLYILLIVLTLSLPITFGVLIMSKPARHAGVYNPDTRLEMFNDAIDEMGPNTVGQALELFAKGLKFRNGAMQYAPLSPSLKKEFYKWIEKTFPYWVTGSSSPWIENYSISVKDKSELSAAGSIIVELKNSNSNMGNYSIQADLIYQDNFWFINNIKMDKKLKEYLNFEF